MTPLPELRKGNPGSMYGGGKVPYAGMKSFSYQSKVTPKKYKITKSSPKVLLPGMRRLVPQEYSTIQDAINACVDGDTVLISEGTYLENIRYKGKAIVVASLYLIDGDTTHIPLTIIDGSNPSHPDSGSVVFFIDGEDTTSVLCGLTITGGTGTYDPLPLRVGGGINCWYSGAKIIHNIIEYNSLLFSGIAAGGGVSG